MRMLKECVECRYTIPDVLREIFLMFHKDELFVIKMATEHNMYRYKSYYKGLFQKK